MAADNVFRRTFRIATPVDFDDFDSLLIRHLERLEADSPFRMQEWVRGALRRQLALESLVLGNLGPGVEARCNELLSSGVSGGKR